MSPLNAALRWAARPLAACAGLFVAATFATPVAAQGYNQFCVDTVAEMCQGRSVTDCFQYSGYWQAMPQQCLGDVESMIEDENNYANSGGNNDGMADGNYDPGAANGQGYLIDAYSWGGNLRTGPGGDYRSIGVLNEGAELQVLAATNVYFNDYPWFLVYSYEYGEGYTWGGIICTRTDFVDGISGYC